MMIQSREETVHVRSHHARASRSARHHQGRCGGGGRNVTFPARQYNVNGERRSFALLRPIVDTTAQGKLRELILDAYAEWEAQAAVAS